MQDNQSISVLEEPACEIAVIRNEDGTVAGYTEIWWGDGPWESLSDDTVPAWLRSGRVDLDVFARCIRHDRKLAKIFGH